MPTPPPHDPTPPDRVLAPLLRRFAAAAFGLLAGIAMNVLGATDLGPWVFLGSLALAVFTAHQIGRSGFDRPRAPARKAPRSLLASEKPAKSRANAAPGWSTPKKAAPGARGKKKRPPREREA